MAATPNAGGAATYEPYFDKNSQLWCYEDTKDGIVYEYDGKEWQPSLASLADKQGKAYNVAGVDESEPVKLDANKKRKRKEDKSKESRNTAVYCTHLPLDSTDEEVAQVFSKAGMILVDPQGKPKVKLYSDEAGNPKGEALIVFLQEESADLAVTLLDQTELRIGQAAKDGVMNVARASFANKQTENTENQPAPESEHKFKRKRGGGDPEKAAAQKQAEKLKKRLEGWESDDELEVKEKARLAQKPQNTVVFMRMFTLPELEKDPTLLLDLKEDVRDECENFGKVTNVVLYDKEPDGIITVRFADPASATACIAKMQGRNFAGRKIGAYYADPKVTKTYRKSKGEDNTLDREELEQQEKARLDQFATWLEKEGAPESSAGPSGSNAGAAIDS